MVNYQNTIRKMLETGLKHTSELTINEDVTADQLSQATHYLAPKAP